eukprot:COSAG01_NODE_67810_length_266_cov_0.538922_2_plen_55_part_01
MRDEGGSVGEWGGARGVREEESSKQVAALRGEIVAQKWEAGGSCEYPNSKGWVGS